MDCLWKAWRYYEQKPTTFTKEEDIQPAHPSSTTIRLRDLAPYNRTGTKTEECTERNGKENAQYHMERNKTNNTDKGTNKG